MGAACSVDNPPLTMLPEIQVLSESSKSGSREPEQIHDPLSEQPLATALLMHGRNGNEDLVAPTTAVTATQPLMSMVTFLEGPHRGESVIPADARGASMTMLTQSQPGSSRSSTHSAFRAHRPASLPAADGGVYEVPYGTNPFLPTATSARPAQFESHPIVAAPILLRIDGLGPSDDVPTDHYDEHMRLRPLDPSQYVLFHIPHATYTNLTPQPYSFTETTSFTPFTMDGTFFSRLEQMRSDLGSDGAASC